jgi:hypothetical protein
MTSELFVGTAPIRTKGAGVTDCHKWRRTARELLEAAASQRGRLAAMAGSRQVYRRANRSAQGTGFSRLLVTGLPQYARGSRVAGIALLVRLLDSRSTRSASAPSAPQLIKADCRICARSSGLHVSLRYGS